jgi:acyl dehydratase
MADTLTVEGITGIREYEGKHLGYSDWLEITQDRVNGFAEATGDHQWIHVDPERAAKEGPFGGPIAHGYLTVSLAPVLMSEIIEVTGINHAVNYGINKLRFPATVPVGAKLRVGAEVVEVKEPKDGSVQVVLKLVFEVEGQERPACVGEFVYLYFE